MGEKKKASNILKMIQFYVKLGFNILCKKSPLHETSNPLSLENQVKKDSRIYPKGHLY